MRNPRSFYEAKVVVVPCGPAADEVLGRVAREGLSGIALLEQVRTDNGQPGCYRLRAIGGGWASRDARPGSLGEVLDEVDVVVLVVGDLHEVDPSVVALLEVEARACGDLFAAVLVAADRGDTATRDALATLRERVDMLVDVRSPRLVAGFLDVVRGGRRDRQGVPAS